MAWRSTKKVLATGVPTTTMAALSKKAQTIHDRGMVVMEEARGIVQPLVDGAIRSRRSKMREKEAVETGEVAAIIGEKQVEAWDLHNPNDLEAEAEETEVR